NPSWALVRCGGNPARSAAACYDSAGSTLAPASWPRPGLGGRVASLRTSLWERAGAESPRACGGGNRHRAPSAPIAQKFEEIAVIIAGHAGDAERPADAVRGRVRQPSGLLPIGQEQGPRCRQCRLVAELEQD